MSTSKTPNYQLSQWLATDPVRMSDFNADNAIIDAALKAEADAIAREEAARRGETAALAEKAGAQLLKTITLPTCKEYSLDLTDLDWNQWKAVHISMEVYTSYSLCSVSFYANSATNANYLGSAKGSAKADPASRHGFQHLLMYPLFDKRRTAKFLSFGSSTNLDDCYFAPSGLYFEDLKQICMVCSSDYEICAGSNLQVWGEK